MGSAVIILVVIAKSGKNKVDKEELLKKEIERRKNEL